MLELLITLLILIIVAVGLWRFLHREPKRTIKPFNGYLSPANGIVVDIIDVSNRKAFIKKDTHGIHAFFDDFPQAASIIVIMMKPHHVHTQRAPVDGKIMTLAHKPGTFLNAVYGEYAKATVENEHVMLTISGKRSCKVYAIAGTLARRIEPLVELGQHVKQGERISRISFGSQVALVLPKAKILVHKGQTVVDGVTKVAA